jgi:hypothetical protein
VDRQGEFVLVPPPDAYLADRRGAADKALARVERAGPGIVVPAGAVRLPDAALRFPRALSLPGLPQPGVVPAARPPDARALPLLPERRRVAAHSWGAWDGSGAWPGGVLPVAPQPELPADATERRTANLLMVLLPVARVLRERRSRLAPQLSVAAEWPWARRAWPPPERPRQAREPRLGAARSLLWPPRFSPLPPLPPPLRDR